MPTESIRRPATDGPETIVSPIENEIPAYRAISPTGVVALVLGVFSILCFASWYFLVVAVAAVVLGYLADRAIQAHPDALTGRGLARAGIGLGLVFGLTAVTVTTVQGVLRVRQAKAFARTYEDVITKGTFAQAVWYSEGADTRAAFAPDDLLKKMTEPGPGLMVFEEHHGGLKALKAAVAGPGADFHLDRVESHGEQDLVQFVGLVYDVHTPEARAADQKERKALIVLKGSKDRKGRFGWWVSDVVFPYQNKTFVAPQPEKKAGDDGHGHSH